jgi:hypothetical protein
VRLGWGVGGRGPVITGRAHPPPYFGENAFLLRVQLRAGLAARPRGIQEPEWGVGCVLENLKTRFLKGF